MRDIRRVSKLILAASALIGALATGCRQFGDMPQAPLRVVSRSQCTLPQVAAVESFVPLANHPDAMLGGITRARIDLRSGDILVADSESTKAVYRFTGQGAFVTAYKPPLGSLDSAQQLADFEILPDSSIVIASDSRLFRYSKEGQLTAQVTVAARHRPYNLAAIGDSIYVLSARTDDGYAVHAYDANLKETSRFHRSDPRIERYAFLTWNSLAAHKTHIFVTEFYRPLVMEYDTAGNVVRTYDFGPADPDMEEIWSKAVLTEPDRAMIRLTARRFLSIYSFGDSLLLYEAQSGSLNSHTVVLDPSAGVAARLSKSPLIYHNRTLANDPNAAPTLRRLVGSYPGGLLSAVSDATSFAQLRNAFTDLSSYALRDTDNPALVKFRLRSADPESLATNCGAALDTSADGRH